MNCIVILDMELLLITECADAGKTSTRLDEVK